MAGGEKAACIARNGSAAWQQQSMASSVYRRRSALNGGVMAKRVIDGSGHLEADQAKIWASGGGR